MSQATRISDDQLILDLDWLLEGVHEGRVRADALLSKALFKLETFKKATKSSLTSLVIDTFNDNLGIDPGQTSAQFDPALGLFKVNTCPFSYTLLNPPSTTYPDSGNELADNILPPNVYANSGWVGWQHVSPQIQLDLQNPIEVGQVRIYYLVYQSAGIYSPNEIRVEGSDDALQWSDIGQITVVPVTTTGGYWASVPCSGRYRYLRITVEYRNNWVFLGEIVVLPKYSTIVSNAEALLMQPTTVFVVADEELPDGSQILYFASRDGGVTWSPVTPGETTSLRDQPPGTTLRIKAELHDDAKLKAWAFGWF